MAETTVTGGTQGSVTVARRELEQMGRALANLSRLADVILSQKLGSTEKKAAEEIRGLTAMVRDMTHRWQA